jgi:two-component system sensor histidine kinase YesM
MNFITKMLLLITLMMTPVIILYLYSNQKSIQVVEEQINISNQNRLAHFLYEFEGTMDVLSRYSNVITKDPDFVEFAANAMPANRYDYSALRERIERKLALFSLSTDWLSRINLYFPASRQAISSLSTITYDEQYLSEHIHSQWTYRNTDVNGVFQKAFTRHFITPHMEVSDFRKASVIIEVDLMEDNIIALLDTFKSNGNNDPFLYQAPHDFVLNKSADESMAQRIVETYDLAANSALKNHDTIILDNKKYLIYFYTSPKLNWTLVDYVPLEDILSPVTKSRQLFYVTVSLLLLAGISTVLVLYYHVQVPIRWLTESVSKLKKGEFSVRITGKPNQEFQRLIIQFNEMASQIQFLVEKVYKEEIRSKEAVMKQLQSQINPHFLYNSFAYIISMAKMNRPKPIESMAYSLADYYKYTTRNNSMVTTLGEELAFVNSYVVIMNHQLNKINYEIAIPPTMEKTLIPRLIIQPIVENAIVHGLEAKLEEGGIRITGIEEQDWYQVIIEDDGIGMTDAQLFELNLSVNQADSSGESLGLWNVSQRLRYHFGEESGIRIESSASGGLMVQLRWQKKDN